MTAIPTPPPLTPVNKTPIWEDFLDIFYAPSVVFERRKADPKFFIGFLVVSILAAVILLAGKGLLQGAFDADFARGIALAMKKNPQLTPEMMEKGKAIGQTFTTVFLGIATPIAILLVGPILWLCGKAVGATEEIGAAWMVAMYAYFPRVLGSVFLVVQPLLLSNDSIKGMTSLSVGPARFFDPATSNLGVMALMGRLDLFTIWGTVLLAIGLKVTGKVSLGKALTAAGLVWLIASAWPVIAGLRAG
ncbi:MAG: YIP1 family protein [Gemmatimonadales bacterium]